MTSLVACTVEPVPPTTGRAALELPNGEVDCSQVLAAIKARRTLAQQAEALTTAQQLRADAPHVDIPTELLVSFYAPAAGEGDPGVPAIVDDVRQVVKLILCDPLTREIVSQRFIAFHPEYRL